MVQLRNFAGGPVGSSQGLQNGPVLDDTRAYKLLESYCVNFFARGFKLYKLYDRAAAFIGHARSVFAVDSRSHVAGERLLRLALLRRGVNQRVQMLDLFASWKILVWVCHIASNRCNTNRVTTCMVHISG